MKKSETSAFLCNYLIKCTVISRSKRPDIEILALFSLIKQIPNCCITNMQVLLRQAHLYRGEISPRYGLDNIFSPFWRMGNYPWPLSNQILEAWLWLVRIESKDDVMKPINSHTGRREIQIVKLPSVLCDVKSTDRSKTFYLLVCPREPEEASAKQAGGKVSEIVSECKE